jgi:hypothetical protein
MFKKKYIDWASELGFVYETLQQIMYIALGCHFMSRQ